MDTWPLLFYPIEDDMHDDKPFELINPIHRGPRTEFPKVVLVETLEEDAREAEIWLQLEITEDDFVVDKRLFDDFYKPNQRALITYMTIDAAQAAVLKYHRTPEFGGNLCAILVDDLLLSITLMGSVVNRLCDITEQDQIVAAETITIQPSAGNFREHIIRLCGQVSSAFSIYIKPMTEEEPNEGAYIKFSNLHEAFSVVLAFDSLLVQGRMLSLVTVRNPVWVQHDLKKRVALACTIEQLRLIHRRYIWGSDLPNQMPVGCSNFRCEGCGNKDIKIVISESLSDSDHDSDHDLDPDSDHDLDPDSDSD